MDVTKAFAERGDLAHLALFLWASGASALLVLTVRELLAQVRRFDEFVAEVARLNERLREKDG
ncbi:hypothetical protein [Chthonobacter rhizosphaerae]|uniref:hypothetical protein n=1 Tax=Chthonobacter rhizosphaerae TaxID=2735553 RepID=UPI0015EF4386|nr:hypothetical protein [Chthonobacter rhizosphaerae]